MAKFLTHESIAEGMFNREHCTASTSLTAWQEYLVNSSQLLELLCARLRHDWLSTPLKFRKAWNCQQIVSCFELATHPFLFGHIISLGCYHGHLAWKLKYIPQTLAFILSVNVDLTMCEEGLQRSCGAFLACMDQFAKSVSSQRDHLMKQTLDFYWANFNVCQLNHRSQVEHNNRPSHHY